MKLTYWGHSCFFIETSRARLVIDPFLTGNPKAAVKAEDVHCDYVLVTHGHNDHVGDALDIANANDATVIANFEIASFFEAQGAKAHGMHIGGGHEFPFGKVKLTIAHHGSTYQTEKGMLTLGNPAGMLIMADGKTIYHAGDTGLFLDMQLIGQMHPIDVALLPIGDNYTMGVEDAAKALSFLVPKVAIPMHYNTFPAIDADPHAFAERAQAFDRTQVEVLTPGETYEF